MKKVTTKSGINGKKKKIDEDKRDVKVLMKFSDVNCERQIAKDNKNISNEQKGGGETHKRQFHQFYAAGNGKEFIYNYNDANNDANNNANNDKKNDYFEFKFTDQIFGPWDTNSTLSTKFLKNIDTFIADKKKKNLVYFTYGFSGSGKTFTTTSLIKNLFDKLNKDNLNKDNLKIQMKYTEIVAAIINERDILCSGRWNSIKNKKQIEFVIKWKDNEKLKTIKSKGKYNNEEQIHYETPKVDIKAKIKKKDAKKMNKKMIECFDIDDAISNNNTLFYLDNEEFKYINFQIEDWAKKNWFKKNFYVGLDDWNGWDTHDSKIKELISLFFENNNIYNEYSKTKNSILIPYMFDTNEWKEEKKKEIEKKEKKWSAVKKKQEEERKLKQRRKEEQAAKIIQRAWRWKKMMKKMEIEKNKWRKINNQRTKEIISFIKKLKIKGEEKTPGTDKNVDMKAKADKINRKWLEEEKKIDKKLKKIYFKIYFKIISYIEEGYIEKLLFNGDEIKYSIFTNDKKWNNFIGEKYNVDNEIKDNVKKSTNIKLREKIWGGIVPKWKDRTNKIFWIGIDDLSTDKQKAANKNVKERLCIIGSIIGKNFFDNNGWEMIFDDDDRTFFKTLKVADYENLFKMLEEKVGNNRNWPKTSFSNNKNWEKLKPFRNSKLYVWLLFGIFYSIPIYYKKYTEQQYTLKWRDIKVNILVNHNRNEIKKIDEEDLFLDKIEYVKLWQFNVREIKKCQEEKKEAKKKGEKKQCITKNIDKLEIDKNINMEISKKYLIKFIDALKTKSENKTIKEIDIDFILNKENFEVFEKLFEQEKDKKDSTYLFKSYIANFTDKKGGMKTMMGGEGEYNNFYILWEQINNINENEFESFLKSKDKIDKLFKKINEAFTIILDASANKSLVVKNRNNDNDDKKVNNIQDIEKETILKQLIDQKNKDLTGHLKLFYLNNDDYAKNRRSYITIEPTGQTTKSIKYIMKNPFTKYDKNINELFKQMNEIKDNEKEKEKEELLNQLAIDMLPLYAFNKEEETKDAITSNSDNVEDTKAEWITIENIDELEFHLDYIDTFKQTKCTSNNPYSSRSHIIMSFKITNMENNETNYITICDLAGKENFFEWEAIFDNTNFDEQEDTWKTIYDSEKKMIDEEKKEKEAKIQQLEKNKNKNTAEIKNRIEILDNLLKLERKEENADDKWWKYNYFLDLLSEGRMINTSLLELQYLLKNKTNENEGNSEKKFIKDVSYNSIYKDYIEDGNFGNDITKREYNKIGFKAPDNNDNSLLIENTKQDKVTIYQKIKQNVVEDENTESHLKNMDLYILLTVNLNETNIMENKEYSDKKGAKYTSESTLATLNFINNIVGKKMKKLEINNDNLNDKLNENIKYFDINTFSNYNAFKNFYDGKYNPFYQDHIYPKLTIKPHNDKVTKPDKIYKQANKECNTLPYINARSNTNIPKKNPKTTYSVGGSYKSRKRRLKFYNNKTRKKY